MSEHPQVEVPQMCQKHQRLLVEQLRIGPEGPWQIAIVAVQIVLFQGSLTFQSVWGKIGGDVTKLKTLGCLACERPDVFGEAIEAYRQHGIAGTKARGERYVAEGKRTDG